MGFSKSSLEVFGDDIGCYKTDVTLFLFLSKKATRHIIDSWEMKHNVQNVKFCHICEAGVRLHLYTL